MRKSLFLIMIIAFMIITVIPAFSMGSNMTGKVPPEVSAKGWLNTGTPLELKDLKGKVVVVEFWATWCPPCRQTIPHLVKLFKQYKDKDVVFISLTNEPGKNVKDFAKKMGIIYPVGYGSMTAADYGVEGIPFAVIIGKDGRVKWSGHPLDGMDKILKKYVD